MCRMWEWASGLGTVLIGGGAGDRAGRDACLVLSPLGDRAVRGRGLGGWRYKGIGPSGEEGFGDGAVKGLR